MATCPHCGSQLPEDGVLSRRAQETLAYMRRNAPRRGGFMFECARVAFDAGKYHDAEIDELLRTGAIKPHPDPKRGWVVADG